MSGWRTQIETEAHSGIWTPPKGVVGIVVAQKFPDPQAIRTTLEEGIERVAKDTVWVLREAPRTNHAVTFAWQTLKNHDIEPFLAPLVPAWKSKGLDIAYDVETRKPSVTIGAYDLRAQWRDIEMRATCERIIVFHDKSSNVTAEWLEHRDRGASKIYVVQRGKVKAKKYRKGRKPD